MVNNTTVLNMEGIKEQIHKLQIEIQESRDLLDQKEYEGMSRQELKELTECKKKTTSRTSAQNG